MRLEFNLTFSTAAARGASGSFQDAADFLALIMSAPTIGIGGRVLVLVDGEVCRSRSV